MSILTDWSLMGMFTIKGIIICILVCVVGSLAFNVHAYHEPEDDI